MSLDYSDVVEMIAQAYMHLEPEELVEEYNRIYDGDREIQYIGDGYFSFLD